MQDDDNQNQNNSDDDEEMQDDDNQTPIFKIELKNELYNEYTEQHEMLSVVFPHIFVFGLTKEALQKKGAVEVKLRRNWFEFYDRRAAEEIDLIFLMFDQSLRHKRNEAVSWQINQKGQREQKFINLCNNPNFLKMCQEAVKYPGGKTAKKIKKIIHPLIKISDRKVPWTPLERADTLGKLYSLMHFFNIGTHFITISPCMRHNAVAIRLTYTDKAGEKYELPDLKVRTQAITDNPIGATKTFYRLIEKFFEIIVGIPLTHYSGKSTNIDRLLAKNKDKYIGPYGRITAALGVIEEQAGGSLHYHGILFGGWDIDVFRQHIHKPEVAKRIAELIDSQISCEIPDEIAKKYPVPFKERRIFASEPYPDIEHIEEEAAEINMQLGTHTHSFTCYPEGTTHCRMGMPQPPAAETYHTEIHCDPDTNKPARKFAGSRPGNEIISPPPDYPENGNPFENEDTRKIVFGLKCTNLFAQLQPPRNPITTFLARCNTCIQILPAPSQARTAYYYIAKYCSKHPYDVQRILPLLMQSKYEQLKYGSKAEDDGAPTRVSKLIMEKTCNKAGLMEASDQQSAALALGFNSYFSTHEFKFCPIWTAVKHYRKSQKTKESKDELENESEYDLYNDLQDELENESEYDLYNDLEDELKDEPIKCHFDDEKKEDDYNLNLTTAEETGAPMAISQFDKYLNRGEELENLCLYVYIAIIKCSELSKTKQKNKKITGKKTRGRPPILRIPFALNSKVAKAYIQTIRPCAQIPRLTGSAPPEYPGNPPNKNTHPDDFYKWSKEAKEFVIYYSLLFLPLDKDGLPFEPTQPNISILPWKEENLESWKNFWKIFGSWDVPTGNNPTTKLYKRSMWQIFKNMVENLRQGDGDRRLLRDWRFQCAAKRPNWMESTKSTRKNYDNTEDIDDLCALTEFARAQFAADTDKSGAEKEIKKMNDYLEKQMKLLKKIDNHSNYKKETIKYKTFNVKKCKRMERRLKKDIEDIENVEDTIKV
ncbi:MAG: hypothetical protein GY739_01750 [Mesoflavibacter sp.]|nr:hypothetical protein [Mesoflavibacter sp.]